MIVSFLLFPPPHFLRFVQYNDKDTKTDGWCVPVVTDGRWLLRITIPPAYPNKPPQMWFATPVVHPNVALRTGEICLDLLKDAWAGTYTVLECVRAVRMLLVCPETDSPLNVDVAALIRDGDVVGARRLVELWVEEEKFTGK